MADRVHNLSNGRARDDLAVQVEANTLKLTELVEATRADYEAKLALTEELRLTRAVLMRMAAALEAAA